MQHFILIIQVLVLASYALAQYSSAQMPSSNSNPSGTNSNNNNGQSNNNNNGPQVSVSPSFATSIDKFSVDFYEAVIPSNPNNVIMSPFSAQTALSLLYCGAAGQTESIMAQSLEYPNDNQNAIANQFNSLLQPLQNNPILTIANAIYLMNGYTIQPNYLAIAQNDFYSTVSLVNFANSYQAANTMNNWVAQKTQNKITNLISPDSLNSDTRLVLLNAIYCKGTWVTKFDPSQTSSEAFYFDGGSASESIQMMHVQSSFNYNFINELNAQVIELPYANSDISMVVILPNDNNGLSNLQNNLKNYDLSQLDNNLWQQTIQLSLPKFKIETSLNLKDPLSALGMENIFSDDADFSKILVQPEPLQVTQVVQKAFIEVDENGTTAAAATAIIGARTAAVGIPERQIIIFDANHPFVFLLKQSQSILFMGNYVGQ